MPQRKITKKRTAEIKKEMLEALELGNESDYGSMSGLMKAERKTKMNTR